MDQKFQKLLDLGAGDFGHLDGSLISHLRGTQSLLAQWSASPTLQDAGLYHAAYGTAGFDEKLVSTAQRTDISAIIGSAAEDIVYQYCACDREDFFSQIGVEDNPLFKNRFTGESYHLSDELFRHFCELTAANETEIAIDNASFMNEHGASLKELFTTMTPYLSPAARIKVADVFGVNYA